MAKERIHNEWFQTTVSPRCDCGSNKKSRAKAGKDPQVYVWGEYVSGKWRTIEKVCECCFEESVIPRLRDHARPCGCTFKLEARSGYSLASWLKLPEDFNSCLRKAS